MMEKCNYCMYKHDCIGELPGDNGKCIAFAVAQEDVPAYEQHLKEIVERKQYFRNHYFDGLNED